jgi:hypothetical protein
MFQFICYLLDKSDSQALTQQDQEKLVNNWIRLALFTEESRVHLTREDLSKLVMKDFPRAFLAVFRHAQMRLRDLFGYGM